MTYLDTPQSRCLAAVARVDITPPVGIYHRMWGAATHDRSTGIHRPLTATAMILQPLDESARGDRIVLVGVDHCLLWADEMRQLLDRVSTATGFDQRQILVAFAHTHAAGLMDTSRADLPGGELIAPYLETLAERIAAAIQESATHLQPVTILYGQGRSSLAAERDFWDEQSGQYVCGFNPQGHCDDTVLVARVMDNQRRTVATVVNYACHPTTLAWDNTLISPDYVGAMREVVEAATSAPCLFLQGASGDVGPREGFVGDTAVADRNGRQLGYAALSALESLHQPGNRFAYTGPVVSGATLGTWAYEALPAEAVAASARWQLRRWTIDLPYRPELPTIEATQAERQTWFAEQSLARQQGNAQRERDCHARIERCDRQLARLSRLPPGERFPYPITMWQVGPAVWIVLESEMYNVLQRSLRERFAGQPLMVATIVNGSRPAYLPPREAYGKGLYQESIAVLAAGSLERLIDELANQIQAWQR
jgi:hypothetical protein